MNISGIYKITNLMNGKVYVGQSRNLKRRFTDHKRELRENRHYNSYLQYSFNKYGIDNFKFEIIEACEESLLNEREHYWVISYNSHNRKCGYNAVLPKAEDNGFYHSEESKQKLRELQTVYSKEDLISYLQEYYYHFGKVPTTRDIDSNKNYPSSGTYEFVFGSYKEGLLEADLYEFVEHKFLFDRKEYTKEDILELFSEFIENNGRFPNHDELKNPNKHNLPSESAISRHFSGRIEIREVLNFVDDSKDKELVDAIEGLKLLHKQDGKVTSRTIDKSSLTRSAKYYTVNFGSLMNAYELAGIANYKLPNNATKYNYLNNKRESGKWKN